MKGYGSILGAVLLFIMGCQSSSPAMTQEHRQEVLDSLTHLAYRLADTWNAGEEDAYLDCYLSDSTFTFAANGSIIRGWDEFVDNVRASRAALSESTVTYDQIYADVLGSDLGVVTASFGWSATDTNGVHQQLQGTYTTLMSLTAEGWKVINVAESFPLNGM